MRTGWLLVVLALSAGPRAARAQEEAPAAGDDEQPAAIGGAPAAGEEEEEEEEATVDHRGQIGLHLQGALGYRGIFPYDGEYCGELKDGGGNKANCLGRSPFALDLGLAYGVLSVLEVLIEARIGVERDVGVGPNQEGPRTFALAPGVKLYLGSAGEMTFFATLQLPIDFTSFDQVDKTDFGVKNVNGLQLDLSRNLGVYLLFGEEVSWRRWLRFEIEAGLGVQARFP